ncbi:hypothetical protein [Aminipila sp.]|uniref:hypothetical protein n=1 Tax=Aminipila sp. TaxID=2060095 RepID=UPI00289DC944|nr:hypothetical protein [Aminipila sp.]
MKEIIFKPKYSVRLWISFFSPVALSIISLSICITDRFTDKGDVFELIILSIISFITVYFFYRNIVFRSIIFSSNTIKFERVFFKSTIKNYSDFEHIRRGMISFGNIGIMLLYLNNANEILKIADGKIKSSEFIEKPRSEKNLCLEKLGLKSVYIIFACLIFAMVISPLMRWHLIDTQSDTMIIFFLLSSVILVLLVMHANKK